MKWQRKNTVWLVVVLAILGVGYGLSLWLAPEKPRRFEPHTVAKGEIGVKVISTGVVQAQNRVTLKPPVAGRVEQMLVKEGELVRKNKTLAYISSTERTSLIDSARGRGKEELDRWSDLYRPTPIIAPMNGVVILRSVEPGQTVTETDTVLVIADRLIVRSDVDETDIGRVKLDQPAKITLDAYSDRPILGKVVQIAFDSKTVSNVTVYEVKIEPQAVPDFMKSGMTASVTFEIDKREEAILVPAEAIIVDGPEKFVLTPTPDRKGPPNRVPVKTGLEDGKWIEILSGVAENDIVLVPISRDRSSSSKSSNPFLPMGGSGGRGQRPPRR